jgi:hypothetical protein
MERARAFSMERITKALVRFCAIVLLKSFNLENGGSAVATVAITIAHLFPSSVMRVYKIALHVSALRPSSEAE